MKLFFKSTTLSFLILFFTFFPLFFSLDKAYAATSPWTQTDWSGGSGQTSWSDTSKYDSGSNVNTSTNGQITLSTTSNWYNASWGYRKKITIDNTKVTGDFTTFPVLINLSSDSDLSARAQSDGDDILFTDSTGTTKLDHEIESYTTGTGALVAWVEVPTLANSTDTVLYMYYGNASATNQQNATGVWDSNYKSVWHMEEQSGVTLNDSTTLFNGTKLSATEPNPISAQINYGQSFDGSNDWVDIGTNKNILNSVSATTFESWVNIGNSTISRIAMFTSVNGSNANARAFMLFNSTEQVQIGGRSTDAEGLQSETTSSSISTGTWHHVVGVIDYANDNVDIYIDGVAVGTTGTPAFANTSTPATDSNSVELGSNNRGTSSRFLGSLDEVRISNNVRSATWISTEYNNQSSPSTFYSLASQEQYYASSGTLTASIFDTEQASNWGTLTYTATTPSGTTLTVKARTSNSSSMTGASAFFACSGISSGADLSTNSCVTDTHRYIQYELTFATTDPTQTVTFQDITLAFSASDATAPTVTLTPIADPTNDNTPTITGSATESLGTVSSVEFQVDATSGSWSSCSAADGSFDEATEAFTCAVTSVLSDGSHTIYVRATDTNGNVGAPVSDSFVVDTIGPESFALLSPGSSSYTNNTRPTFSWQAAIDNTTGISNYSVSISNPSLGSGQPSGNFSLTNIPTNQTTGYVTNSFFVSYANFNDSDTTNNTISAYTKSSSDWNATQNDGLLREGVINWQVSATDNAGNTTSGSRILFVDQTAPMVSITSLNDVSFSSNNFVTTDQTPTFAGEILDNLSGTGAGQTQTTSGPKVASGPQQVEISIQQKALLTTNPQSIYTINTPQSYWQCSQEAIADNSQQLCNKYAPYTYTLEQPLAFGTYIVTLNGKDIAGNSSSFASFTLTISPFAQFYQTTPVDSEEEKTTPEDEKKLPKEKEQKKEITKPLKIKKQSLLEDSEKELTRTTLVLTDTIKKTFKNLLEGVWSSVQFAMNTRRIIVRSVYSTIDSGIDYAKDTTTTASLQATTALDNGYRALANQTKGAIKESLLSAQLQVTQTTNTLGTFGGNLVAHLSGIKMSIIGGITNGASQIALMVDTTISPIRLNIARTYEVWFDTEPTRISDVRVAQVGKDYVIITWRTNHYTLNNKVNYGETLSYGEDAFGPDLRKEHVIKLDKLKPDTKYVFEVMSQNKNYVYDAHHEVTTLPDKAE